MIDLDTLDEKFSIEGEVGFAELENDLVFLTISNKYADADICLYGGHVTSFRPHKTMDLLWMSPDSMFEVGKPIRGGIPVCFPWFGPHKSDPQKPQHGFARLMYWNVAETATTPTGETRVRLQLSSSEETKNYWPFDFEAELDITVGSKLNVLLKVTNTSNESFEFGSALHTYFYLSGIENIGIEGLQGTTYYNQLNPGNEVQEEAVLHIREALTRHYLDTEAAVVISDPVFRRRILVEKTGSKVTTVWNPGKEACATIGDLPDDGYESFVCVEAVNAFNNLICLAPGATHETSAIIGLEA
ncbi:D-hexose-6-phosphate mutarotase [Gaoshiqia sediminis]|uniref:Putative glucose-6-phosphate 1-epimerase n=1 Tax=Gaoshiqia sediminis TaxID=2986998 RepID=A0AA41Y8Z4_9BACT|nr:D-hexose-6-phosphate mutarotase [Gaoshiqia sediminis]MCW0483412.1 D-hexose-6-phosphate mutarotase [Gaoshiqia sediminis]